MARPKGEDRGLFERPKDSGTWWIEYADLHGQRRREKVGTKTAARNLYQVRQAEKLQGKLPSSARPRITLAQLLERYASEAAAGKKAKSVKGLEQQAKTWKEALGSEDIRDIKPGQIEAAKGAWLSEFQPSTVNGRLAFLKTMFGRAVRDGLVEVNPLANKRVKMLREAPPRDRLITPEEEEQLLAYLPEGFRRAVLVALYSGLRQAEQFAGQRRDVDLGQARLRINDAKGGGRQWLDLSPRVVAVLREQLASHKSRYVWPAEDMRSGKVDLERALAGDVALDRLTAAARALELPEGILWHTLRHTFISRLVMLGTPLPTVQKLARHKSLSMTMRYSHMCPDHTRQALAALDSFAAPTKRP